MLKEVHADGLQSINESQLAGLAGLQIGAQVSKADLQAAANKLFQSGWFAKVKYSFASKPEGLVVTFQVEEGPHFAAYFDDFPWFADSELNEAIRKKVPFYQGFLPGQGTLVDDAAAGIADFLAEHQLTAAVEHQALANPVGEGSIQRFYIEGTSLQIEKIEFSDPALNSSLVVQQQIGALVGKAYSRLTIDLFLAEQVRPLFQQKGFLKVKLGPAEVRLPHNSNQKLPDRIPIYIPVAPGEVYRWKGAEWTGNSVVSAAALNGTLAMKAGDVADGMALEAGWDRVREEYGRLGYLDTTVEPAASYDDQAHTVAYTAHVNEGKPYKFGKMVLTGLSTTAEKLLREAWPIQPGAILNKKVYEDFVTKLQTRPAEIFKDLALHYDTVGHWLQTDASKGTVDVLLDFK
jgi:outer membrane protein insertion porin family